MMPISPRTTPPSSASSLDLRKRVEDLGSRLAERLSLLLSRLPQRATGPQALARNLDMTTATASRLLKALGESNPIRTLEGIPGPNPLRRVISAAQGAGAPAELCQRASEVVEEFDELIRTEARSRNSFLAMVSAWLPDARRDFEAKRRQAIFQSTFELEGVCCDQEIETILLHPGESPDVLDVVSMKCLLGIDRIRPEAVVQLATMRMPDSAPGGEDAPRLPTNLDGQPALDGMHSVRLDEFCDAPPAPLEAERIGSQVQYSLGPTGLGKGSKVDLVVGEVNRGELLRREPSPDRPPYFFTIPEMASRRLTFDLMVHEEAYGGAVPELLAYRVSARGPARAGDPERRLDRRDVAEELEDLGHGLARVRSMEFPRYGELLRMAFDKLGWNPDQFRTFRVVIPYPQVGTQITMGFLGSAASP